MRASVAYFAGAGTVIAAIAAGLGGGLLMANIISPHAQKPEMTRLEQRMSSKSGSASSEPDQPQAPVPYLAATPAASAPASAPADPPHRAANPPPKTRDAGNAAKDATPPPVQDPQASPPENAYAKARDTDPKRADDRKRAERRQQWMSRRQHGRDQQDDQNQHDADTRGWNDDRGQKSDDRRQRDDRGWGDRGPREIIVEGDDPNQPRSFGGPMRTDFPHFNLFGPD